MGKNQDCGLNLIRMGVDIEKIEIATGLSKSEIKKL